MPRTHQQELQQQAAILGAVSLVHRTAEQEAQQQLAMQLLTEGFVPEPITYETVIDLSFFREFREADLQEWINIAQQHIMPLAIEAGMRPSGLPYMLTGIDQIMRSPKKLLAIRDGLFSLNDLASIERAGFINAVVDNIGRLDARIRNEEFTLQDILNIHHQHTQQENMYNDDVNRLIAYPQCIAAVRDNLIPLEFFSRIFDYQRIDLISQTETISAIMDGRTNFETLDNLSLEELQQAVDTDQYPNHHGRLNP